MELTEHLGRLQESQEYGHAEMARLGSEMLDVMNGQGRKRMEDYKGITREMEETMKSANNGNGDANRDRSRRPLKPEGDDHPEVGGSASQSDMT